VKKAVGANMQSEKVEYSVTLKMSCPGQYCVKPAGLQGLGQKGKRVFTDKNRPAAWRPKGGRPNFISAKD